MAQHEVEGAIRGFLTRTRKITEFEPATALHADGLGLDSLETAELAAVLEDEFGSDPFSAGLTPGTVGEVVAFYDALPAQP